MTFSTSDVAESIEASHKEKDTFFTPKIKGYSVLNLSFYIILRLVYYIAKIIFQKYQCSLLAALLKS